MVRKHVVVRGEVQGVGYRWTARHRARQLGVTGFARNTEDGSVDVEVEGAEVAVAEMLDWLASGPPSAIVTSIEVTDAEESGDTTFEIAH
jgi:acylphosphatase